MSRYKYEFSLKGEHMSLMRAMAENGRGSSQDIAFFDDGADVSHYYFSSIHLEGLTDVNDVWDRATQLLQLYNAAHEIVETSDNNPRLHYSTFGLTYLYIEDTSNLRHTAPVDMHIGNIPPFDEAVKPEKPQGGPLYGYLLYLSRMHREAYQVLLQVSQVMRMPDYYRVHESIETYMDKVAFNKLLTDYELKDAYKRFNATTNNYSLGGPNSRHGEKEDSKTNKELPAKLSPIEAKGLAMSICRGFFASQYGVKFSAIKTPEPTPPASPNDWFNF